MGNSSPIYGLIGKKLGHSFSQKYFSEKFAREGIEARYELFERSTIETFPTLWQQHPQLRGLNVTIPYKTEVIPYLDRLTPEAQAIGAVNTIRKDSEGLIGFNSDIYGFRDSLREFLGPARPRAALILGTGGAAKAVAYVLEYMLPIPKVLWVSRKPTEPFHISYEEVRSKGLAAFPLIINTTPLGMYPKVDTAPDLPYEELGTSHFVYDLVYNPEATLFLQKAQSQGAKILNGLPMLIGQAEKSWEFWRKNG